MAVALGNPVIATAGTKDKCDACLALGAALAINYKDADFAAEARDNGPSVHDGGWAEAAPESGEGAAILLHAEMTKGADEAGGAFPRCEGAHAADFLALVFLAGLEGLAEAKR
jgi:hypothetical protein